MTKLDEIKSEIVKKIHEIETQQDNLKSLIGNFIFEFEMQKQKDQESIQKISALTKQFGAGHA